MHASEPEANPMQDWYATLAKLKTQVPADVLVLPAHNDAFHGLHERRPHPFAGDHRRGTLSGVAEHPDADGTLARYHAGGRHLRPFRACV